MCAQPKLHVKETVNALPHVVMQVLHDVLWLNNSMQQCTMDVHVVDIQHLSKDASQPHNSTMHRSILLLLLSTNRFSCKMVVVRYTT